AHRAHRRSLFLGRFPGAARSRPRGHQRCTEDGRGDDCGGPGPGPRCSPDLGNGRETKLDHNGFAGTDFAKAKAFYLKALAPLGIGLVMEVTPEQTGGYAGAGFGSDAKPYFWIGTAPGSKASHSVHVALAAPDRKTVDAFYKAAMAAG